MKRTNGQSGITLIALVVTIVVLLILAGITITYVLSDGGIFGTANQAANDTKVAAVKEYTNNAAIALYTRYFTDTTIAEATSTSEQQAIITGSFPSGANNDVSRVTVTFTKPTSTTALKVVIGGKVKVEGNWYAISYDSSTGVTTAETTTAPTE